MKKIALFGLICVCCLSSQISWGQYVEKNKRDQNQQDNKQQNDPNSKTNQNTEAKPVKNYKPFAERKFGEKLTYGGNIGLTFGNQTVIELAPMVGYRVTEKFMVGLGVNYFYYRFRGNLAINNVISPYSFEANLYGGRAILQYVIIPQAFLYFEQEMMNTQYIDRNDGLTKRTWLANPLAGVGYRQSVGGWSAMNIMVLYNLNYQPNFSFYPSPWIIRVGVLF